MARSADGLTEPQQVLASDGQSMAVEPADLRGTEAASMEFARIEAAHGAAEVLVNSTGAARRRSPDELDGTALRQAMDAKHFTCLHAIDAAIHGMTARGRGAIINVIRQGGRRPVRCILVGAANATLMLATVGEARAYAEQGVRVDAINPGITRAGRMERGDVHARHRS